MAAVARRLVSKQKLRLKQDGFDLDLTYITDQVIAMGLPCTGTSALYRNPQSEVIRFLNTYHEDNFKIYNLCTRPQDQYDPQKFGGSVASFPFEDHGVPNLEMVDALAHSVQTWLDVSPDRVVCIHCLAGKGRTGLMVCAALLHMGVFQTARDAMAYYGEKRMKNKKGVTQASQRRWVEYYEQVLEMRAQAKPMDLHVPRLLTRVVVRNYPPKAGQLSLSIEANGQQLLDAGLFREEVTLRHVCRHDFGLTLNDEEGKPMATLWLHASFIDVPILSCSFEWFDKERHNKKHKNLKKCVVEFHFDNDGSFTPDRGRTLPPTKDTGWYTALAIDEEEAGAAEEAEGPPAFRADGLDEEFEDSSDEDDELDDPEARQAAMEEEIMAQRRPVHLVPAVANGIRNMFGGGSRRGSSMKEDSSARGVKP